MPWFKLPLNKDFGGIKSASVRGPAQENYNGLVFVDRKGKEHLTLHSERHMVLNAEFDKTFRSGRHSGEQVPGARSATVGSFPGGGGSGGGGPDEDLWHKPEPQAIMGLNSVMVYGGNYQIAMPLNFQLALGSNLQVCVNPQSFLTTFPDGSLPLSDELNAAFGSGLGGNMQLTLGTSTNVVLGQPISVNLGPTPISLECHDKTLTNPAARKLALGIGAVVIVFVIAYGAIHDDDGRAALLMIFQMVMQTMLIALMDFHQFYHAAVNKGDVAWRGAFKPALAKDDPALQQIGETSWQQVSIASTVVTAMIMPLILESCGEAVLDK
jgi:hypothetical protein